MSEQGVGKLKQLKRLLTEGVLVDSAWFSARDYCTSLRNKYIGLGRLEQPARRAYRRPRGPVELAAGDYLAPDAFRPSPFRWWSEALKLHRIGGNPVGIGGYIEQSVWLVPVVTDVGVRRTNPVMSLTTLSAEEPQETVAFGCLLRYRHPEPMIARGI